MVSRATCPALEDLEDVLQVAAVEGDLGLGALQQDGVNLVLVVANGLGLGRDDGPAGAAVVELGSIWRRMMLLPARRRWRRCGGAEEVGEVEYGPGGAGLGNELLVVGKAPGEAGTPVRRPGCGREPGPGRGSSSLRPGRPPSPRIRKAR